MLDSKLLRNSLDLVEDACKKRGFEVDLNVWKKLEETRKALQSDTEKMQASLNGISKEIGKLKTAKKKYFSKRKRSNYFKSRH